MPKSDLEPGWLKRELDAVMDLEQRIIALDDRVWFGGKPSRKLEKFDEEIRELKDEIKAWELMPSRMTRASLADEIGDVLIVLTMIAGRVGLSAQECARRKFEDVERRYGGEE